MAQPWIFRSMLDGRPVRVDYRDAPPPPPLDDAPTEPTLRLPGPDDDTVETPTADFTGAPARCYSGR